MRNIISVVAAAALFTPAATAAPSVRSRELKGEGVGKGSGKWKAGERDRQSWAARTCDTDTDCLIAGCGDGVCGCRTRGKRNLKGRGEGLTPRRCEEGEVETVCEVDPCTGRTPACGDDGLCALLDEDHDAVSRADPTEPTLIKSGENDSLRFTLNAFSASVLGGYESCSDLAGDLTQAARHLASKIIQRYSEHDDAVWEAVASATATTEHSGDGAGGESSWETNNQVGGVDEADVVKSDGERVYAAYGDKVVVWSAAGGAKVAEIRMPEPHFHVAGCDYDARPSSSSAAVEVEPANAPAEATATATATATAFAEESVTIKPGHYPGCYRPRARVESLLLRGTALVALVGGYNSYHFRPELAPEDFPILQDYGSVQARAYNTSSLVSSAPTGDGDGDGATLPELELLWARDLPGHLSDARSVGSNAHVVTLTGVETYWHVERHLARWEGRYWGMDRADYIETATQHAAGTVIPNFVGRFVEELRERHGDSCSDIARLSVYQTGGLTEEEASEHRWWDHGVLGGICSVSSFDMGADRDPAASGPLGAAGAAGPPAIRTSAAFVPNAWGTTVYATADKLFLAGMGYEAHPELGYVETTMIYAYELPPNASSSSSSAARAIGVGQVPGTVLNQFSLDFYGGHLRVATTVWARWGCIDLTDDPDDGCTWRQTTPPLNRVTVLAMPTGGVGVDGEPLMKVAGRTPHLGKPDESITAVRFMGDLGFVVTFERVDPFIVLDLRDPTDPRVSGELEISGWSDYLHHTGDGDTVIAVGQEADSEGRRTGLQITLFSFADRTAPVALARYVLDQESSSSPVEWDHRAFRYLPLSKVVILPATAHGDGQEFFDGFIIFDVKETDITLRFEVNLANANVYYPGRCYYNGYLQARSMVFDGQVTLMKAHFVESYDLNSDGDLASWTLDLDADLPQELCHYNYWWWI